MASKASSRKILITSGPTAVPIDRMRVITNRSTGEMGRLLANEFIRKGYHVTLLEGLGASTTLSLSTKVIHLKFFFYDELSSLLKHELKRNHHAVIHAAAVSDFKLNNPFTGKLSSGKTLTLKLYPTEKLINKIKKISPKCILVGYKLETKLTKSLILEKVKGLFNEDGCDLVVTNSIARERYAASIIDSKGNFSKPVDSKEKLVKALSTRIDEILL